MRCSPVVGVQAVACRARQNGRLKPVLQLFLRNPSWRIPHVRDLSGMRVYVVCRSNPKPPLFMRRVFSTMLSIQIHCSLKLPRWNSWIFTNRALPILNGRGPATIGISSVRRTSWTGDVTIIRGDFGSLHPQRIGTATSQNNSRYMGISTACNASSQIRHPPPIG